MIVLLHSLSVLTVFVNSPTLSVPDITALVSTTSSPASTPLQKLEQNLADADEILIELKERVSICVCACASVAIGELHHIFSSLTLFSLLFSPLLFLILPCSQIDDITAQLALPAADQALNLIKQQGLSTGAFSESSSGSPSSAAASLSAASAPSAAASSTTAANPFGAEPAMPTAGAAASSNPFAFGSSSSSSSASAAAAVNVVAVKSKKRAAPAAPSPAPAASSTATTNADEPDAKKQKTAGD